MKKKIIFIIGFFLFLILAVFLYPKVVAKIGVYSIEQEKEEIEKIPVSVRSPLNEEVDLVSKILETQKTPLEIFLETLPLEIPKEKILDVPFICQNPFQNTEGWKWHDESCEEAAALQAVLYLQQNKVTKQEAHEMFLDMIEWQKRPERFGEHKDLYNEEMRIFIRDYFQMKDGDVLWIPKMNDKLTKKIITAGYPIIMPVSGESIGNPFYPYPGYHMLTAIGFTKDKIITNDNGTKRGEKYPYDWEVFLRANAEVGGGGLVIKE